MQAFGLLVLMENDYLAPITIDRLRELNTVGELEMEAFLAFVAALLKVPRSSIAPDTKYGSIPEWDSVNHLRLCMESEKRFGWYFPIEKIPEIRVISDFVNLAQKGGGLTDHPKK